MGVSNGDAAYAGVYEDIKKVTLNKGDLILLSDLYDYFCCVTQLEFTWDIDSGRMVLPVSRAFSIRRLTP